MSSVRYLHNGNPTIHIYSHKKGGPSLVSAKSKLLIVKQSQKVLKLFFFQGFDAYSCRTLFIDILMKLKIVTYQLT